MQLESCGASDLGALQRFQRLLLNHLNSAAHLRVRWGASFWEPRTLWLFPGRLFLAEDPGVLRWAPRRSQEGAWLVLSHNLHE